MRDVLNNKMFYIDPNGEVTHSVVSETLKYVVGYLNKQPVTLGTEAKTVYTPITYMSDIDSKTYFATEAGYIYKKDSKGKMKKMQPYKTKVGYLENVLTKKDGGQKHVQLHRVIASVYLGVPKDKTLTDVNHIDTDKTNCAKSNVEWMTHSDNVKHSYAHDKKKK